MNRSVATNRGERVLSELPQPFKFIILLIVGLIAMMAFKHFQDGYRKIDGEWEIRPALKDRIDDKTESYDNCEVYYLIALKNGLYSCRNCEGGAFFLFTGEVAKIGMTCDGENRYRQSFYETQQVRYQTVFYGSSYECQQEEIRLLGTYATMPENMQRPDPTELSIRNRRYKLLYPVFNTTLK